MDQALVRYQDPWIFIPAAAIAIIIFSMVHTSLVRMGLFPRRLGVVIAICATVLAMYGMDRVLIQTIVEHYAKMGTAMLIGLASLLLSVWGGLSRKWRNK